MSKVEAPIPPTKEKQSKKQKLAKELAKEPIKEEVPQEKPINPKSVKQQQAAPAPSVTAKPVTKVAEDTPKVEAVPVAAAAPQNTAPVATNTVKDKKKKKSEFNTLQQLSK